MVLDFLLDDSDKNLRNKLRELNNDIFFNLNPKEKTGIKKFLLNLPYYYSSENYLFVHAGFNTRSIDPFIEKNDMLNIRIFQYNSKVYQDKRIIHGHNPKSISEIKKAIISNKQIIPLDNGCVYKEKYPELGRLLCLELNKMELISQQNCD